MMGGIDVGEIPTHPHLRNYDKMSTIVINPYLGGANWWEAGGATGAIAVWQPIDAASLAASYTDLSGNFNDADPVVAPTWNSVDGWVLDGVSQYIRTPFSLVHPMSVFIRFSDRLTDGYLSGASDNTYYLSLAPRRNSTQSVIGYGSFVQVPPVYTTGVVANTTDDFYYNGVGVGRGPGGTTLPNLRLFFGAANINTSPLAYGASKIQAVAIYNNTLSATQVAAVSDAMAAL